MRRGPAPPRAKAPMTFEQMAVIKKKISAPSGKPAGMMNFKAPKKYAPGEADDQTNRNNDNRNSDGADNDDEDDENDRPHNSKSRGQKPPPKIKSGRRNLSDVDSDDNVSEVDMGDEVEPFRGKNSRTRRHDDYDDDNYSAHNDKNYNKKPNDNMNRKSNPKDRRDDRHIRRDDEHLDGPDEESENPYDEDQPRRNNNSSQVKSPTDINKLSLMAGKAGIFNFRPILHSTYRELRAFVLSSPPVGNIVRCYIERNRHGSNMLSPVYSLCADLEDGTGRELMVCRKVLRSRSPHYIFSLKSEDLYRKREQRSRLYLGKLRSTDHSEYVLFDNGVMDVPGVTGSNEDYTDDGDEHSEDSQDNKGHDKKGDSDSSLYKQQMAVIYFNTKSRPVPENIRGMEICIPVVSPQPSPGRPASTPLAESKDSSAPVISKALNLQQPFQKIRDSGRQNEMMANKFFILHEKQSKYDPLSSCLVDFKGRANVASVKNFQLVESFPESGFTSGSNGTSAGASRVRTTEDRDRDVILLQMGKATEQCFNLDFRAPLTMLQAFAIAVARIGNDIALQIIVASCVCVSLKYGQHLYVKSSADIRSFKHGLKHSDESARIMLCFFIFPKHCYTILNILKRIRSVSLDNANIEVVQDDAVRDGLTTKALGSGYIGVHQLLNLSFVNITMDTVLRTVDRTVVFIKTLQSN
eukprot:gene779-1502_t